MLPHNEYLVLQIRLPAGVSATLTDEAGGTKSHMTRKRESSG